MRKVVVVEWPTLDRPIRPRATPERPTRRTDERFRCLDRFVPVQLCFVRVG